MSEIEYLCEIFEISFVGCRVKVFIVPKPVFVTQDNATSQFEVPCEESIHVEIIHILIRFFERSSISIVASACNICELVVRNLTPIVP